MWELHQLGYDVDDIGDDGTDELSAEAVDHVKVDRLLRVATRHPSSALYAAQHGWDFPVSREWIAAADVFDALNVLIAVTAQSRRQPKPYPRPWRDNNTSRLGKTTLSPAAAREVLTKNRG
ncbi:hypothetical protein DEI99_005305 [Curtobacterium sp. MCLR17_036]|uniref:hypothetical protein n=1 Tax=Curtobacterium sp. MCLR17_036 TaxID=2175620 RepID=UPI000DAAA4D9|nr:hypothetical protein [Curtobacterium sp. MCLR17_036]WIE65957.1 hypothetical protein DEI99_005305 [Curtobacterium sp. MCLR17_036]